MTSKSAFHRSEKKAQNTLQEAMVCCDHSPHSWCLYTCQSRHELVCFQMMCLQFPFVFTLCDCVLLSLCVSGVCYVRLDKRTCFFSSQQHSCSFAPFSVFLSQITHTVLMLKSTCSYGTSRTSFLSKYAPPQELERIM